MSRHFPLALLVLLTGCAGCDSARLDDRLVAEADPLVAIAAQLPVVTTTTVAPPPKAARPPERASRSAVTRSAVRVPPASPGNAPATDAQLDALAQCESHGNPRAVGGGGRFFGAFQFTLQTWRAVGMTGNPVDYDYATQREAARRIPVPAWLPSSYPGGRNQFPACARQLRRLGVI